ncbi:zinc finger and SCAN domain-containing protein 12-like isoform X2 [Ochlerotatus camptorhynchus]|uniref:zinc finger and SCAN domain-containing protein 12-like isoform X2 n=1 Tax=Ochlerotatus camptorhynchus TaxID=644619 RepID=UPI0031D69EAC
METRKLKKVKEEIVPGPSFEEVTVKEEPQDVLHQSVEFHAEEGTASTSRKRTKAVSSTNTPKSPNKQSSQPPKTTVRKKSRYTQVIPEDIDLDNVRKWNRLETHGEDKPIDPTGLGEIVPQCRLCLRRVSRENLEIIVAKHKKKARVAFQIRIFPHDAYPFICSNCLNLMDIFIDFKNAVTQAKSLLVNEKAYLETNGWDDPDYIDAFQKCKQVVELHRKQIDSMYEELANPPKKEYGDQVDDDKTEENIVENNDMDDPEYESSIKAECITTEDVIPSLPTENPNTEIMEQNTEEVEKLKIEVAESIPDDSMDEDFIPDDEEEDEDFNPKVKKQKTVKIKKAATAANACKTSGNKQLVSRQLCDFCGASVRPESVESHRNAHLGIRPYACSMQDCALTFTSRFNLGKHIKRIHKESEVHTCNICGKQIRGTIGVLKYHQQRHNVDQKKHICQVCGKAFTMKWYLTQHSIIHTGDFPHKCKYCGKKFNNKWSMKTHEKNIHEKKTQIKNEENQSWNPENFSQTEPQPHIK